MQDSTKTPARPRGRPRAYDPEHALKRARDAFWRTGYSGTSLDALSDATGMNRPSLYAAFGDKRALYLAAVDRYIETGRDLMLGALSPDVPLAEGLQQVYDGALALYLPVDGDARGCFLIGTSTVEAMTDPDVRARLGDALRAFDRAFEKRFRHAQTIGEIDAQADAALLAKLASAVLHSLALRSRAGDTRASLRATARAGVAMLCDSVRPPSETSADGEPKPARRQSKRPR